MNQTNVAKDMVERLFVIGRFGNYADAAQVARAEEIVNQVLATHDLQPGATGRMPFGQRDPSDQGELTVVCYADHEHGVVVMEFGKPVAWLSATPEQYEAIIAGIQNRCRELTGRRRKHGYQGHEITGSKN